MAVPSADIDSDAFVARYAAIYEHSPWVAERTLTRGALPVALTRGHGPAADLHDQQEAHQLAAAFAGTVAVADVDRQRALILAHPDLVGRAALAGELTDDSNTEQSSAGLDRCTPDELARFQTLNTAYRTRFGFPFIMAVRGSDKAAILSGFESRIDNDPHTEFTTALREIDRIAVLRLEAMVQQA